MAKPNVLVQFCQIWVDHTDLDVDRNPSMYNKSVDPGRVVRFRAGKRIEGRSWRSALGEPVAAEGLHEHATVIGKLPRDLEGALDLQCSDLHQRPGRRSVRR